MEPVLQQILQSLDQLTQQNGRLETCIGRVGEGVSRSVYDQAMQELANVTKKYAQALEQNDNLTVQLHELQVRQANSALKGQDGEQQMMDILTTIFPGMISRT